MIAAIVLGCSIVFFLQFFVPYCRSLIAASSNHVLSPEVQDVTGLTTPASGEDFHRVVQLLYLCPDRPEDRGEIRAIGSRLDRTRTRPLHLLRGGGFGSPRGLQPRPPRAADRSLISSCPPISQ